MLTTKNIAIEKHVRVFSLGNLETAKEVWLLFHGYGQDIETFFAPTLGQMNGLCTAEARTCHN